MVAFVTAIMLVSVSVAMPVFVPVSGGVEVHGRAVPLHQAMRKSAGSQTLGGVRKDTGHLFRA